MRIGLFTDTYPPYINGVSTSTMMLKKALEKESTSLYPTEFAISVIDISVSIINSLARFILCHII